MKRALRRVRALANGEIETEGFRRLKSREGVKVVSYCLGNGLILGISCVVLTAI